MTRNRFIAFLFAIVLLALPAAAYEYTWDCRGGVTWPNNDVTWKPSLVSFPYGSSWNASVEAMRLAWNAYSPGGNYRINYTWTTAASTSNNDGQNSIILPSPSQWIWGGTNVGAITLGRRTMCWTWPGARADIAEMDIIFNPNVTWDTSTNPNPSSYLPNATIVGVHEHGHGMGLAHENDVLATMNSVYPNGGPIGTRNDAHPHADDTRGNRNAYGTAATQRDLASFAYLRTGAGTSAKIPAPYQTDRNAVLSFQFTVENRGTTDQSAVPVYFYLSPTRNVSTSSFFIGSASININSGVSTTLNVGVTVPTNAPTGYQYIGWIIDPFNSIMESDEGNNAVALVDQTYVNINNAPTACFSATPTFGSAPLYVQFDASCSYDPDGGPITYTWDFGDGYSYQGGVYEAWEYWEGGLYVVTLTVTDQNGSSRSTSRTIRVTSSGCGTQIECNEPL